MDDTCQTRYIPEQCIKRLRIGDLHRGKDLFFNREVLLFVLDPAKEAVTQAYIQSIRSISRLSDERFIHVLDFDVKPDRIMAVLQPGTGRLFLDELGVRAFSELEILKRVRDLGYGMREAKKQGITGFSVSADNLWSSEELGLSVINYWEPCDPQWSGAQGLCRLLAQMLGQTLNVPADPEQLCEQLQSSFRTLTEEQTTDLMNRIRQAMSQEMPLPQLLSGLDKILSRLEGRQDIASPKAASSRGPSSVNPIPRPTTPSSKAEKSAEPAPMVKRSSAWNRKWVIGGSILAILLLVEFGTIKLMKPPELSLESKVDVKAAAPTPSPQQQTPVTTAQAPTVDPSQVAVGVIPKLTGVPREEAEKQALAAGLRYKYVIEPNEQAQGIVFKQDLEPNTQVPKGTQITFWVSRGQ
ncbi:Stk1 family PASTA domain-containing Ser/Thr kinase [Paenibacillus cremeus]|uniref:PASTA domain-containing protein n=1 Tax=Paenibacillus cremeus TaxID=2163881 RepID=A0A559KEK2_9BACL|nr:PASTA domain-containing protein [Paenibacillus cremeus]TVY10556.1 PASTA domain-containing protein [Paenibacillus cremeus]